MIGILKLVSFLTLTSLSAASLPPDCSSKPCANGGTCITEAAKDRTYTCKCPPAYVGETCAYKRCDDSSNPCLNGGTCVYNSTSPQSSYCKCAENWSGDMCEYWILLTDFDVGGHINMTTTRDMRYSQFCATFTDNYAFIPWYGHLKLTNDQVGADGKEFCLSFKYKVDNLDAEFYVSHMEYLPGGAPGDYRFLFTYLRTSDNFGRWIHFRETLLGVPRGRLEMTGRIPGYSRGILAIDQIKVVKGVCKS